MLKDFGAFVSRERQRILGMRFISNGHSLYLKMIGTLKEQENNLKEIIRINYYRPTVNFHMENYLAVNKKPNKEIINMYKNVYKEEYKK